MKWITVAVLLFLLSCGSKEEVLLPKSNLTLVENVLDHSPIYFFFKLQENDTVAVVNRKNSIISTNWIFNIDRRLPLRKVIPEIIKLQDKKRKEVVHKNENAENYFSYADTIGKNLAFISFTSIRFKMGKPAPIFNTIYFFRNSIRVNNVSVAPETLKDYLNALFPENPDSFKLCFDKNESYGEYIQNKVLIRTLHLRNKKITFDGEQEFIY